MVRRNATHGNRRRCLQAAQRRRLSRRSNGAQACRRSLGSSLADPLA